MSGHSERVPVRSCVIMCILAVVNGAVVVAAIGEYRGIPYNITLGCGFAVIGIVIGVRFLLRKRRTSLSSRAKRKVVILVIANLLTLIGLLFLTPVLRAFRTSTRGERSGPVEPGTVKNQHGDVMK